MQRLLPCAIAAVTIIGSVSCSSPNLSIAQKIRLESTALSFETRGADLTECGLTSEFERGRSTGTNGGGSGCAACAQ